MEEVQSLFLDGFKTLYQTEMVSSRFSSLVDPDWCVKLGLADAEALSLPPSDLEITNALFAMKPFKAPGPDGIHVGFYQRFWGNVGASMKHEIKQIFQDRKVPHYLNQTLIALIPKQDGPTSIGHFRPISLCNSIYNIMLKILVQRLRHLIPTLVSPLQAAFVAGRRSSDNVIIAQELIHSLKRRKEREGFMVIKIDLEKADDRLEWSFVRMVLDHFGFPKNVSELILSCISTTSTSILFNGNKLEAFYPSRGIRQGDPMSPYIFLLCMEYLSSLISKSYESKDWTTMKASQSGPRFSHFFFCR